MKHPKIQAYSHWTYCKDCSPFWIYCKNCDTYHTFEEVPCLMQLEKQKMKEVDGRIDWGIMMTLDHSNLEDWV